MTKVAVVILNYNGQKFLETFLPSVINHNDGYEIFIADNASTDGSVNFLKTKFADIKIIQLANNHGFAGGYNNALKEIEAKKKAALDCLSTKGKPKSFFEYLTDEDGKKLPLSLE